MDCFKSEFLHKNNIRIYQRDPAKVFGEWLSGLPSTINIAFYNHEVLDLAYLFDLLPATATEQEQDKFLNNWFELVASEVLRMHTKKANLV